MALYSYRLWFLNLPLIETEFFMRVASSLPLNFVIWKTKNAYCLVSFIKWIHTRDRLWPQIAANRCTSSGSLMENFSCTGPIVCHSQRSLTVDRSEAVYGSIVTPRESRASILTFLVTFHLTCRKHYLQKKQQIGWRFGRCQCGNTWYTTQWRFLDRVKIFINVIISRSNTITFCVNAVHGLKWTPKPRLLIQSDQSNEDEVASYWPSHTFLSRRHQWYHYCFMGYSYLPLRGMYISRLLIFFQQNSQLVFSAYNSNSLRWFARYQQCISYSSQTVN